MSKYRVYYRINAYFETEVEAENVGEALNLSQLNYWDANFGDATEVIGEPTVVEDENGKFVWEA